MLVFFNKSDFINRLESYGFNLQEWVKMLIDDCNLFVISSRYRIKAGAMFTKLGVQSYTYMLVCGTIELMLVGETRREDTRYGYVREYEVKPVSDIAIIKYETHREIGVRVIESNIAIALLKQISNNTTHRRLE